MPKTILFLAQTRDTPTISEQRAFCAARGDIIVEAGQVSFADLPKRLKLQGSALLSGDRIKVYDLACLPMNTMSLVRIIKRVLASGISIEFCRLGLVLDASKPDSDALRLIAALDHHWRKVHGMKVHADSRPGRKPVLADERLPAIKAMLGEKGATLSSVAAELKIGRSTLFDFLKRQEAQTLRQRRL